MLILSNNFKETCHQATIYLDTNVFINAFDQDHILTLIHDYTEQNHTAFVTLSSVEYEFTRGSRTLKELQDRRQFVRDLVHQVLPVGRFLESDKHDVFSAAMSLVLGRKNSQYTDYLLAAALYSYRHLEKQFILSADVKAFPLQLFSVEETVTTVNSQGEIVHLHLIRLDQEKYLKLLGNIK